MKRVFLIASAAALLATPAMAQSPSFYIQANVGKVIAGEGETVVSDTYFSETLNADLEDGKFASVAFGPITPSKFSLEAEVIYADTGIDMESFIGKAADVSFSVYGSMMNSKYEFARSDKTAAYVGAGFGYGYVTFKTVAGYSEYKGKDDGFMWQIKAGVTHDLNENTSLDFGYRYLQTPTGWTGPYSFSTDVDSSMHLLTAGIRRNF